ncbi:hypothetical protein [Limnochorda pilosa]|uniref:Uncharacterized protein n=1 Tax=Limnochorda pilosa TaxID=1555112 RepID=A0A0K2SQK0_LIMPI|nr:hypothetical protein [Limnochorda pilosa]BAS29376.1 hypothetical protein LIP_3565 [Limnochorda pilosa]
MDLRCPKCNALIAERVPLDDKGNVAVDRELRMELEEPGSDTYHILCPNEGCDGYLRAVSTTTRAGNPGLRILHDA